jgi:predicted metal-dependent peptidase
MIFADEKTEASYGYLWRQKDQSWTEIFSAGLARAVRDAVNTAGGLAPDPHGQKHRQTPAIRARNWFISNYPLLGAIAAAFRIIEESAVCGSMEIRIAAVSPYLQEIYINPAAGLCETECRFVIAHELLHAGLRHDIRHEWRDPYFWNVACDYVINQWLVEMNIGEAPTGILLDEQFKGLSAEAVYDRIVTDMRRFRKIATLRGTGLGDILSKGDSGLAGKGSTVDLAGFYRHSLGQGLTYHEEQDRGYLPSGLVEEIRALAHPPIPWDVELARWFDEYFTPLEKTRSYARPSRRQSSTPDIPRPSWVKTKAALDGRTFGVILDTSGSMARALLAAALGAIASYAASRDVPGVRVVFCDAASYDQGYLRPEDIAGTVKVRGRGGTVLQPGIDLLQNAGDFPQNAPLLVITDGYCEDHLLLYGREHAFLIPEGNRLPFVAKGKIFRLGE